MSEQELKQREAQFEGFGKLLAEAHARRRQAGPDTAAAPSPATHLGRYVRAARVNAGLTPSELAARSGMDAATILALEQGLVAAADITPARLNRLARALNESPDDFYLLLGQPPATATVSDTFTAFMARLTGLLPVTWRRWRTSPALTMAPAALLCILISGLLLVATPHPFSQTNRPAPLPVAVPAPERPSLLKAERLLLWPHSPAVEDKAGVGSLPFRAPPAPAPPLPGESAAGSRLFSTLWGLSNQARLNLIKAEFGLKTYPWSWPGLIEVDSFERLNLIKAETQL